jgi:hypothetical protein
VLNFYAPDFRIIEETETEEETFATISVTVLVHAEPDTRNRSKLMLGDAFSFPATCFSSSFDREAPSARERMHNGALCASLCVRVGPRVRAGT